MFDSRRRIHTISSYGKEEDNAHRLKVLLNEGFSAARCRLARPFMELNTEEKCWKIEKKEKRLLTLKKWTPWKLKLLFQSQIPEDLH